MDMMPILMKNILHVMSSKTRRIIRRDLLIKTIRMNMKNGKSRKSKTIEN